MHYHFPGKAELGEALIARYAARFGQALAGIDASGVSAFERLAAYAGLYLGVLKDERMCLCGMLAAEYQTLPGPMRRAVVAFFDDNHAWLTGLLKTGRTEGTVRFAGRPEQAAQMIVGSLEGAMLVARPYADTSRFQAVADQLLSEFGGTGRPDLPPRRSRRVGPSQGPRPR